MRIRLILSKEKKKNYLKFLLNFHKKIDFSYTLVFQYEKCKIIYKNTKIFFNLSDFREI